jgi:hypothetical protein
MLDGVTSSRAKRKGSSEHDQGGTMVEKIFHDNKNWSGNETNLDMSFRCTRERINHKRDDARQRQVFRIIRTRGRSLVLEVYLRLSINDISNLTMNRKIRLMESGNKLRPSFILSILMGY